MSTYENLKYNFNGSSLTGIQGVNTGLIMPYGKDDVPTGFLACDGTAVSRTTYSTLFTAIGTTWGTGDGSSTFNVPDLTDRVAIGKSPVYALASTGGANAVTSTGNIGGSADPTQLTTPVIASHAHPSGAANAPGAGSDTNRPEDPPTTFSNNTGQPAPGAAGGDEPHTHPLASITFTGGSDSVLQPYLTVMYIIKT